MKFRRPTLALISLSMATTMVSSARAQFDFGDITPRPVWEQFKLNPKARIKLDFRNASVDAVLQALSAASGITIIKDPALTGGITLQSPKPQALADAFAQLNAVLGLKGYDLKKEANFLVIRSRQQARGAAGGAGGRFGGMTPEQMQALFAGGAGGGGVQLRVYSIKYANASQVARVVNEVFAGSGGGGLDALQQLLGAGGGGFGGAPVAPPVTPPTTPPPAGGGTAGGGAVQGGFGGGQGRGGFGGFGGGQGNRGGFGGFGGGGFGGRGGNTSTVRASADDYSNSVIVNAPNREQDQVARLIEQIDRESDQPQQSKVFPLQFAVATDLVNVVQNVLVSNAPRGRGGQQAQGGGGGFGGGFGGGGGFRGGLTGIGSAFGTVVAEARTNSLIVTATGENVTLIGKVIEQLDKPITFENSSFVVTLENARADQIAQLLNSSFGGRNGAGGARATTGLTGAGNRTGANRNTGGGGGGNAAPAGLGGRSQDLPGENGSGESASELPIDIENPDSTGAGELATTVTVAQGLGGFGGFGGGGQFGGQGNRQRTTGPLTGLDSSGRVVNVRDLTGQVTAIPDINTNSVIIVTSPENRALIQQILSQLDKIPEQVMIETLIVEASLDATDKLGVEWSVNQGSIFGDKNTTGTATSAFGLRANTAQPQGFRYTLTGNQYTAFLTALKTDSRFDVLSTPRIFTSNNATAEINISQSLPYVLSQRTDANGNLTFNYSFLDVGIILTVTPRITSNGYVTMDVTQTANDFVRYTDFNAPVVNQREAQTTVSVKDGETVVLGGVIRNTVSSTVNKLPILGDIPLLGNLFKSTSTTRSKTELLVFLTPRVVRDPEEARKLRERTQNQLSPDTQKRIDPILKDKQPEERKADEKKPSPEPEKKPEVKPAEKVKG